MVKVEGRRQRREKNGETAKGPKKKEGWTHR